MKVGDAVRPKDRFTVQGVDYGLGVIIDSYTDDDGMEYLEVVWQHETQWWKDYEVELISESR